MQQSPEGSLTMSQIKGKFGRQYRGIGYNALVTMEVAEDTQSCCDEVRFAENWHGCPEHWIGNGDPQWRQGAVIGVQYALRLAGQVGRCITVISVEGDYTVTNPTIVGAAAIDGVWRSIGFTPLPDEVERINKIVFSSWQDCPRDGFPTELPDFERSTIP